MASWQGQQSSVNSTTKPRRQGACPGRTACRDRAFCSGFASGLRAVGCGQATPHPYLLDIKATGSVLRETLPVRCTEGDKTMTSPRVMASIDAAVDAVLDAVPGDIVLGIPLAIGKPNR